MLSSVLTFVCSRFSEITLREVLGSRPPRAFLNMDRGEREQLYWALKAQTTAQRGQELLQQQAPPVRFGPNRDQTEQPRRGRRARVLSSEQRRERLAHGQAAMDLGGGEVRRNLIQHSLLTNFSPQAQGQSYPCDPPPCPPPSQPLCPPQPSQPPCPPQPSQPPCPPQLSLSASPPPQPSVHASLSQASQPASPPQSTSSQAPVNPPQPSEPAYPPQPSQPPASPPQPTSSQPRACAPHPTEPASFACAPQPMEPTCPESTFSTPTPQPILSPPSLAQDPPLFPPRPAVFMIPATPPPAIPPRVSLFMIPATPAPAIPPRLSLFMIPATPPPVIPPRPALFMIPACPPPAIPPRLFLYPITGVSGSLS